MLIRVKSDPLLTLFIAIRSSLIRPRRVIPFYSETDHSLLLLRFLFSWFNPGLYNLLTQLHFFIIIFLKPKLRGKIALIREHHSLKDLKKMVCVLALHHKLAR